MKIRIKLNARFSRFLPDHALNNEADIDVDDNASIESVLAALNLPLDKCRLVLVNGEYSRPAERTSRQLTQGDRIDVWPPLAGG